MNEVILDTRYFTSQVEQCSMQATINFFRNYLNINQFTHVTVGSRVWEEFTDGSVHSRVIALQFENDSEYTMFRLKHSDRFLHSDNTIFFVGLFKTQLRAYNGKHTVYH